MFRMKPYTKCLDCIRTDNIKCKNCMDKLVNDIMNKNQHASTKVLLRRSPKYKHLYSNKYPIKIEIMDRPAVLNSISLNSMRGSYNNRRK